jgi:EmrB/QacA subfamily drug resistance transporter
MSQATRTNSGTNPDTPATPAAAPAAPPAAPRHDPADELRGGSRALALTGLFVAMFVSMISMSVVSTSMPVIIGELGGTQAHFTWVVTATMLASAVSTPIWGKLADLTNKKLLIQLSLVLFVVGSMLAGISADPNMLIAFRVIQGLGAGGLGALIQVVIADIISPRERGKYMGIMGAIMAVGMVGGPLLGGWITGEFGWRWNFYVAVPIAVIAIILLQLTLHLHTARRRMVIDYWGLTLITLGFSSLLIWVTLAGNSFDWLSWWTLGMVGGGVAALVGAVFVELHVEEPLIPMTLFRNRTFTMAVVASIAVGLAMMGTAVFLGQYMQLARGRTPTESGLYTIPMMAGVLVVSTIIGQIISRTGKWKRYMVAGGIVLFAGLLMMGQLRYDTDDWYVGVAMFVMGAGVGACMQNLVLVVQNTATPSQIGVASSAVNFFRTIGGTAGISALGAVLAMQIRDFMTVNLSPLTSAALAIQQDPANAATIDPALLGQLQECGPSLESMASGTIPEMKELCEPVRLAVEEAYGHGIGDIFLYASPLALVALVAMIFLPNIPLSRMTNAQKLAAQGPGKGAGAAAGADGGAAAGADDAVGADAAVGADSAPATDAAAADADDADDPDRFAPPWEAPAAPSADGAPADAAFTGTEVGGGEPAARS